VKFLKGKLEKRSFVRCQDGRNVDNPRQVGLLTLFANACQAEVHINNRPVGGVHNVQLYVAVWLVNKPGNNLSRFGLISLSAITNEDAEAQKQWPGRSEARHPIRQAADLHAGSIAIKGTLNELISKVFRRRANGMWLNWPGIMTITTARIFDLMLSDSGGSARVPTAIASDPTAAFDRSGDNRAIRAETSIM
jgi:hypothetical protein